MGRCKPQSSLQNRVDSSFKSLYKLLTKMRPENGQCDENADPVLRMPPKDGDHQFPEAKIQIKQLNVSGR